MVSRVRLGARAVKDYRMGRVQQLVEELAASSPTVRRVFQVGGISMVAVGGLLLANMALGAGALLLGRPGGRARKSDKTL
jgi:hypothetical protein